MADKTEQPTPKKLRRAREEGQVPRSRELSSAFVLLAAALTLSATGSAMVESWVECWGIALAAARGELSGVPTAALTATASLGIDAMAPVLLAVVATGTLVAYLQVGSMFTLAPITPKLERLDPVQGAGRIFSQRRLVDLLKSIIQLLIVVAVVWTTLGDAVRGVLTLSARDASAVIQTAGLLGGRLLLRVALAVLLVGVLDVFYQRWRHLKDQKMSRDEVKRERRESEGDPHAVQHRKRMHREIAAHGVLEEVRGAEVLIVNPTHLAVALRYDRGDEEDAPEVVAKGQEELARRMIRAAEEAGVPIMRDVPLARALYDLSVGDEIPEALYEAVAVVLHAAWSEREDEDDG